MAKEWAKKKVSMSILYSNLTVNRFHWSCFLRKKFPKWHQIEALLWKVVSTTGTSMFTYSETFLSLTYKTRLICIVRLCKCPRQMKKKVIGILLRRIYIFKTVADVEVMQGLFFRLFPGSRLSQESVSVQCKGQQAGAARSRCAPQELCRVSFSYLIAGVGYGKKIILSV